MDMILPCATTLDQSDLSVMAMNGYTTFHKAAALLEPQHQIGLCHIQVYYNGIHAYDEYIA